MIPRTECQLCSSLKDQEYATQKYGWEQFSTSLPAASSLLTLVYDYHPNATRLKQLKQCPDCGSYYLYTTDYEYLVNGSEDEECLTRLSPEQSQEYLESAARNSSGSGDDHTPEIEP